MTDLTKKRTLILTRIWVEKVASSYTDQNMINRLEGVSQNFQAK